MPNYIAVLSKKAKKQLDKLPDNIAEPILDTIGDLEKDPRQKDIKNFKAEMVTELE